MQALNLKLVRDFWSIRAQAVAIALVITGGMATWIIALSTMDSLSVTQRMFYQDYRFASVFAGLTRAPRSVISQVEEIPGVLVAEGRVQAAARFRVAGFDEPIEAQVISLPDGSQPQLNRVHLTEGRLPDPDRPGEIVLIESFAEQHGLGVGDQLLAIIRGREFEIQVSGIGLSPEYVYYIRPGDLFPDHLRYGIAWMGEDAISQAFDMEAAFNSLSIATDRGVHVQAVIEALDRILERWGGIGAYGREDQLSHAYLSEELNQLEGMARIIPVIFLGVAAFLLSIVVARIIRMQRDQIAVLKAFGYANATIAAHYLLFMLAIVAVGIVPGILLGAWLGQGLSSLFSEFYRFPDLSYRLAPSVVLSGGLLTVLAAGLGTARSLWTVFSLPPAEAMRPEPPTRFHRTVLERLPLIRRLSQPSRMVIRNLERHPFKAGLSIIGIALATAILVTGHFQEDTIDYMLGIQFGYAAREDMTVVLTDPRNRQALHELSALPGVRQVEAFRMAPVKLISGHRSYRTVIQGLDRDAELHRIVDRDLQPIVLPEQGLLLTDWLADELDLRPGDPIEIQLLERDQPLIQTTVMGLAREFIGVSAYMEINALNRLLDEDEVLSGVFLLADRERLRELYADLQQRPNVVGSSLRLASIESFNETMGETRIVFSAINTVLAGIIAFGVIYNTMRLALSERGRGPAGPGPPDRGRSGLARGDRRTAFGRCRSAGKRYAGRADPLGRRDDPARRGPSDRARRLHQGVRAGRGRAESRGRGRSGLTLRTVAAARRRIPRRSGLRALAAGRCSSGADRCGVPARRWLGRLSRSRRSGPTSAGGAGAVGRNPRADSLGSGRWNSDRCASRLRNF